MCLYRKRPWGGARGGYDRRRGPREELEEKMAGENDPGEELEEDMTGESDPGEDARGGDDI